MAEPVNDDLAAALAADFDSDSDNNDSVPSSPSENVSQQKNGDSKANGEPEDQSPKTLQQLLSASRLASVEQQLQHTAVGNVDPAQLTHVRPLIPSIRQQMAAHEQDLSSAPDDTEWQFLEQLQDLPVAIQQEMALLQKHVTARYAVVFPELATLVRSPVDYCKVVLELGQDLVGVRAHEPQLRQILSPDKVLALVMAALVQFPYAFELSPGDMAQIQAACTACVELAQFLDEVAQFMARKLAAYAPNVAAVVGPVAAAQLLMSTGSLQQLAATPSCNLASFGVRDLSAQQRGRHVATRATGYIFFCPAVVGLPPEVVRPALRIVSAKVTLAARIDLARSATDGSVGRQFAADVQTKIDRLLTPPERAATKALPVPKEQKSKKRAGRRFRKMREKFQMSELRKAQNKMSFGKAEESVVDAFGEEVGLGMSRSMDGVSVSRNTDAKMSKAMISRLQQQKQRETLEETFDLAPAPEKRASDESWGTMKRQRTE